MYFKLNPECLFVVGKNGSIICDSFNGKIYHLNKDETKIIIKSEKNNEIESHRLYEELENACLGTFYEHLPYIQKIRTTNITHTDEIEFNFKKFFLEINSVCDKNCLYCGNQKMKRSLGCLGCNIFKEKGERLKLMEFHEIIECISNLGCEELYLTGGNLTLNWDMVLKILSYSKYKFKEIYITISYKNISKKIINSLKNSFIHLIIQIDLNDFNKENLFNLENITYLVIVPENCEEIFYEKLKNMDNTSYMPDFLTQKKLYNPNLNNNFEFNIDSFFHNIEFHPCLGKSIFISSKGTVHPCPMLRTKKWGNIKNKNLLNFFQKNKEKIYIYWRKNLDYIENCKKCEFRYLCTDCRALEEEISQIANSKTLCRFMS